MFGEYIKEKRLQKELSLREFSRLAGEDVSNWSKIERGVLSPPKDKERLENIAEILGISTTSDEWNQIIDMIDVDRGQIPDYIMSDKEVLQTLPIFFRTIGSVKPTQDEINQLIEKLRKGE